MNQDFNEKVKNLYETDIGDFKRKVLLYLNRFQEQVPDSGETDSYFHEIKEMLLCNDTTDIELLRLRIMRKAFQIKKGT